VLLGAAVTVQGLGAALMWRSVVLWVLALGSAPGSSVLNAALAATNLALLVYMALWIGFLVGGLYFGYWIKQGPFQVAHLLLFTLTLLTAIFINGVSI
jgi:hypothetical protein